MSKEYILPNNLILLISGVPGVGKTTISYELLKSYNEFRLVEETDIVREILRGYKDKLAECGIIDSNNIYPHDVLLNYEMAKQQCDIMKNSILNIINRQQRKNIPSIINGVHIIPEVLCTDITCPNVIYINLYVDSECTLWERLKDRNSNKYTLDYIPYLFQTNLELHKSFCQMAKTFGILYSINVSNLSIKETIVEINRIFSKLYGTC